MKKNCVSENVLEIKKCELLSPLPDLMTFNSGVKVNSITDWNDRRKELFETAVNLQYGDVLPNPEFLEIEALYKTETSFPPILWKICSGRICGFFMVLFIKNNEKNQKK